MLIYRVKAYVMQMPIKQIEADLEIHISGKNFVRHFWYTMILLAGELLSKEPPVIFLRRPKAQRSLNQDAINFRHLVEDSEHIMTARYPEFVQRVERELTQHKFPVYKKMCSAQIQNRMRSEL